MTSVRHRFLLVLLLTALLSSAGCAARLEQARTDVPTVLKVKIQDNKAFPDGAIREELAQRQTSILHFIPPFTFFQPRYYLDGTDWRDDRTRITNFYALRGFFDAEILSSQIVSGKRKRANGDPEFVRVVHTVREGEPSFVRRVRINVVAPARHQGGARGRARQRPRVQAWRPVLHEGRRGHRVPSSWPRSRTRPTPSPRPNPSWTPTPTSTRSRSPSSWSPGPKPCSAT